MPLPSTFQFSQNNLQDFVDCPRRFQLRYRLQQPWPAVQTEPLSEYERLMEQGRRFHQLVHQHTLGLPIADLNRTIDDSDLRRWWRNYLEHPPQNLPTARRHPEVTLWTSLGGYRLKARYDLVALDHGGRAVIVDWKTSRRRPDSAVLAKRLQTRVYRYVLREAGTALNGGVPLSADQIALIYWFAEHPTHPEVLPYDDALYNADGAVLANLVAQVAAGSDDDEQAWPLSPDHRHCRFCSYRSLCDRGVTAGPLNEFDADQALEQSLEFEFEELEEIEY
jgi:CRISPR/Cas system-associated exonuclease Cas4 (RecB family)